MKLMPCSAIALGQCYDQMSSIDYEQAMGQERGDVGDTVPEITRWYFQELIPRKSVAIIRKAVPNVG